MGGEQAPKNNSFLQSAHTHLASSILHLDFPFWNAAFSLEAALASSRAKEIPELPLILFLLYVGFSKYYFSGA